MTPAAPADFGLEADRSLKRLDGGRLLVGGSPLHILRLSATGARLLAGWLAGEPVGGGRADQALARRLLDSGIVHPRPGPDPSVGLGSVTAVIPVRDDPSGLAETLAALGGSITAVVVDDASVDAPAIAEVARRFGARLLVRPVNGGPGAARNTGLAQVTSPIVVFVDADATIDPPALEALLDHFSDPVVDAVAPRVRSRPGPGLLAAYEAEHSPLDMGGSPSAVGPQRRVHHVPAAVLSVRADTARRAGGFDESMRWGEDVDFVWRLARGGATVRYEPVASPGTGPEPPGGHGSTSAGATERRPPCWPSATAQPSLRPAAPALLPLRGRRPPSATPFSGWPWRHRRPGVSPPGCIPWPTHRWPRVSGWRPS